MTTWPSATKASTTHVDAGTDQISLARADLKQNIDNVNNVIDYLDIGSATDQQVLHFVAGDSATVSKIAPTSTITGIGLKNYKETIYTGGSTTGTITPNCANGNTQKITLTGDITFNAFASPVSGQSMVLIVIQPSSGTARTLTSTMKFANGFKTLSTANSAIDIIGVFYDGTNYYANLSTAFA